MEIDSSESSERKEEIPSSTPLRNGQEKEEDSVLSLMSSPPAGEFASSPPETPRAIEFPLEPASHSTNSFKYSSRLLPFFLFFVLHALALAGPYAIATSLIGAIISYVVYSIGPSGKRELWTLGVVVVSALIPGTLVTGSMILRIATNSWIYVPLIVSFQTTFALFVLYLVLHFRIVQIYAPRIVPIVERLLFSGTALAMAPLVAHRAVLQWGFRFGPWGVWLHMIVSFLLLGIPLPSSFPALYDSVFPSLNKIAGEEDTEREGTPKRETISSRHTQILSPVETLVSAIFAICLGPLSFSHLYWIESFHNVPLSEIVAMISLAVFLMTEVSASSRLIATLLTIFGPKQGRKVISSSRLVLSALQFASIACLMVVIEMRILLDAFLPYLRFGQSVSSFLLFPLLTLGGAIFHDFVHGTRLYTKSRIPMLVFLILLAAVLPLPLPLVLPLVALGWFAGEFILTQNSVAFLSFIIPAILVSYFFLHSSLSHISYSFSAANYFPFVEITLPWIYVSIVILISLSLSICAMLTMKIESNLAQDRVRMASSATTAIFVLLLSVLEIILHTEFERMFHILFVYATTLAMVLSVRKMVALRKISFNAYVLSLAISNSKLIHILLREIGSEWSGTDFSRFLLIVISVFFVLLLWNLDSPLRLVDNATSVSTATLQNQSLWVSIAVVLSLILSRNVFGPPLHSFISSYILDTLATPLQLSLIEGVTSSIRSEAAISTFWPRISSLCLSVAVLIAPLPLRYFSSHYSPPTSTVLRSRRGKGSAWGPMIRFLHVVILVAGISALFFSVLQKEEAPRVFPSISLIISLLLLILYVSHPQFISGFLKDNLVVFAIATSGFFVHFVSNFPVDTFGFSWALFMCMFVLVGFLANYSRIEFFNTIYSSSSGKYVKMSRSRRIAVKVPFFDRRNYFIWYLLLLVSFSLLIFVSPAGHQFMPLLLVASVLVAVTGAMKEREIALGVGGASCSHADLVLVNIASMTSYLSALGLSWWGWRMSPWDAVQTCPLLLTFQLRRRSDEKGDGKGKGSYRSSRKPTGRVVMTTDRVIQQYNKRVKRFAIAVSSMIANLLLQSILEYSQTKHRVRDGISLVLVLPACWSLAGYFWTFRFVYGFHWALRFVPVVGAFVLTSMRTLQVLCAALTLGAVIVWELIYEIKKGAVVKSVI